MRTARKRMKPRSDLADKKSSSRSSTSVDSSKRVTDQSNPFWHTLAVGIQTSSSLVQRQCVNCEEEQTADQNSMVQPRLTIGDVDDPYEKEADDVSEQVMRAAASSVEEPEQIQTKSINGMLVQRLCSECNEDKKDNTIQAKSQSGSNLPSKSGSVQNTISSSSNGFPVSDNVRHRVEPVLGADLSNVQVHKNPSSHKAAKDINAKAFTHKNHVYLGEGQSAEDIQLMAHELTHTVQQSKTCTSIIQRQDDGSTAEKKSDFDFQFAGKTNKDTMSYAQVDAKGKIGIIPSQTDVRAGELGGKKFPLNLWRSIWHKAGQLTKEQILWVKNADVTEPRHEEQTTETKQEEPQKPYVPPDKTTKEVMRLRPMKMTHLLEELSKKMADELAILRDHNNQMDERLRFVLNIELAIKTGDKTAQNALRKLPATLPIVIPPTDQQRILLIHVVNSTPYVHPDIHMQAIIDMVKVEPKAFGYLLPMAGPTVEATKDLVERAGTVTLTFFSAVFYSLKDNLSAEEFESIAFKWGITVPFSVILLPFLVSGVNAGVAREIKEIFHTIENIDQVLEDINKLLYSFFSSDEDKAIKMATELGNETGKQFANEIANLSKAGVGTDFAYQLGFLVGPIVLDIILAFLTQGAVTLLRGMMKGSIKMGGILKNLRKMLPDVNMKKVKGTGLSIPEFDLELGDVLEKIRHGKVGKSTRPGYDFEIEIDTPDGKHHWAKEKGKDKWCRFSDRDCFNINDPEFKDLPAYEKKVLLDDQALVEALKDPAEAQESLNDAIEKGLDVTGKSLLKETEYENLGQLARICFIAGTPVLTNDGLKAIEKVKVDDIVYSYNFDKGAVELQPVTQLFRTSVPQITQIKLDHEIINTTGSHQFWVNNKQEWMQARALNEKMTLVNEKQDSVKISAVRFIEEDTITYNLSVHSNANYYVGNSSVLVHNSDFEKTKKILMHYYRIKDLSTGKYIYVGKVLKEKSIEVRFKEHKREGKKYPWKSQLNETYKGAERFEIELIGEGNHTPLEQAITERFHILKNGGFNKIHNDGNPIGRKSYRKYADLFDGKCV